MPDNAFTIGAVVDVADVQAGMTAAGEVTQGALDKMLASFQEASTGTARAVARISEDTRIAAVEVDASWQEVARATLSYNSALKEVSAATYLARKAGEDDAAAVNLLAAAKEKAAAASIALSAAQKEAAGSAEVEALSFKELGTSIAEASRTMIESVFGGALIGGLLGHMVNEVADFALEMRNLSLVTGIGASTLAGLHDVTKEMGGDFDKISVGLAKMLKSQQDAVDGSEKQVAGFRMLGISVNELKSLTPEELLFRIADGVQRVGSSAEKNAAFVDIFGKGGRALIPVFESAGSQLRAWVEEAGKASGVTDQNIEASLKWRSVTEQLSVMMRNFALESLPTLVKGIAYAAAALDAIGAVFQTVFESIGTVIVGTIQGVVGLAKVLNDAVTGNFSALATDALAVKDDVVGTFKGGAKDVADAWKSVGNVFEKVNSGVKIPTIPKLPGGADVPGTGGGKDTRLADWKAELQAKKDDEDGFHQLSKDDEAAFWAEKLATVQAGTKLYGEVLHEVRDAERASDKDSLKDEMDSVREKLAATKSGSAERVAILAEEVAHLKSIGADQTSDYKRLQTELIAATRERQQQNEKSELDAERSKAEATEHGTTASLAAWQAFVAKAKELYGADSDEYRRAVARKEQADPKPLKIAGIQDESDKSHAGAELAMKKQQLDAMEQLGLITAQQKLSKDREFLAEEYQAESAALAQKAALYDKDSEEYARIIAEKRKLDDKYALDSAALGAQTAKESMKAYDQFFQHISQGFQSAVTGMLNGTKSFARGMQDLWNGIVTSFVQSLTKMAVQWLQHEVAKLIIHTTTNEGIVASDETAAAQSQSISLMTALKQIAHAAAAAGAHAFKSVMEYVPFPLNVVLAPAAAVGAFAAVMAFGGLASAKDGMVSDEEQLAFIHKNEMVLPASLSQGFQRMLGGGGSPAASGSGDSGDTHFHVHSHIGNVSALDGPSLRETLEQHGDLIGKLAIPHVKRHFRTNGVGG